MPIIKQIVYQLQAHSFEAMGLTKTMFQLRQHSTRIPTKLVKTRMDHDDKIPTEANPGMKLKPWEKENDIHCSICHGEYGNGLGVTSKLDCRSKSSDSSNSELTLSLRQDGRMDRYFSAISNGSASGIMLGLKDKLTPTERWAIVLYLRALQEYVIEATVNSSQNKGGGS